MKKNEPNTLFVISSPFQALCMLEAVNQFKISEYKVLLAYCDELSNSSVEKLLVEKGIVYDKLRVAHLIWDVIPFVKIANQYKRVFLGNYYTLPYFAIASIVGGRKSEVFYLDDGTQILEIVSKHPRKRCPKKSIGFVFSLYELLSRFKNQVMRFFTIYNVESETFDIVRNSFGSLKSKSVQSSGAYIIGTNSGELKFKDREYHDYLRALVSDLQGKYSGIEIYYCPHRRDKNNHKTFELCKTLGVKIFNTEVSVEYDLIKEELYPKVVVGFTSNALFTLKQIFPESNVATVYYNLANEDEDNETAIIRDGFNKSGINTIVV